MFVALKIMIFVIVYFQEAGFSYVELNASDTRSKKSLKGEVAESLDNKTIVDFIGMYMYLYI